jgi:hypothetical protein
MKESGIVVRRQQAEDPIIDEGDETARQIDVS